MWEIVGIIMDNNLHFLWQKYICVRQHFRCNLDVKNFQDCERPTTKGKIYRHLPSLPCTKTIHVDWLSAIQVFVMWLQLCANYDRVCTLFWRDRQIHGMSMTTNSSSKVSIPNVRFSFWDKQKVLSREFRKDMFFIGPSLDDLEISNEQFVLLHIVLCHYIIHRVLPPMR